MPVLKKRDLRRTFVRKCGAEVEETHDTRYFFRVGGTVFASTKVSHGPGNDDVDTRIVSLIARQLGLRPGELAGLVDCELSARDSTGALLR